MDEDGGKSGEVLVKACQNMDEHSNPKDKVMETASPPVKEPVLQDSEHSSERSETTVNGPEMKSGVSTMFSGKTKVKKKMRVEDIITNLKKVKQVASSTANEPQPVTRPPNENGNTQLKETVRSPIIMPPEECERSSTDDDPLPSGEQQEEEGSSFASMCNIRDDPPNYKEFSDLQPLTKQRTEQSSLTQDMKKFPENVAPSQKTSQTKPTATTNTSNPLRQVIVQAVPQKRNQQTPIILNKLPPGFIIRNDLPSGSANPQATPTTGQPKLLLITKSGSPFYLTQSLSTTTSQTQSKPADKVNNSPVLTQGKPVITTNKSSALLKGKPINSNKNILRLSTPTSKTTNKETPLITVQYNLPYPNNNCKVVSNPVNIRTAQSFKAGTFQTVNNLPPRPSRPREMVVNFAGNQTAHITTMTDETSVLPERQTRFIPSIIYRSSPDTSPNKNTKPVAEKRNDKTIFIVTSPSAIAKNVKLKIDGNNKVPVQSPQRRSIYDEKIAKLTGKMTNIDQAVAVNGKAKGLSNGVNTNSNVANVRVSNRKRQQTEKAKLFEKETKKRKRSEERSPGSEKLKVDIPVDNLDDGNKTSPTSVSPSQHEDIEKGITRSPSKKIKTASPRTINNEEVSQKEKEEEKEDDPDSLFRDPALLTREQRALQRALMLFKELEEKQARKRSRTETDSETGKAKQTRKESVTDPDKIKQSKTETDSESAKAKQTRKESVTDPDKIKQSKIETNSESGKTKQTRKEVINYSDKIKQSRTEINSESGKTKQTRKESINDPDKIKQAKTEAEPGKTKQAKKESVSEPNKIKQARSELDSNVSNTKLAKNISVDDVEMKQTEKKSTSEADKTSSRKTAGENQLIRDVASKRKIVDEEMYDVVLKKRKQEMRKNRNEEKAIDVTPKSEDKDQKSPEEVVTKAIKQEKHSNAEIDPSRSESVKRKNDVKKIVPKKPEVKSDNVKDSPSSSKENKHLKTAKDVVQPKILKPPPKTPESAAEKHRVKTYMLVPSYHGFKDFSPIVLGSRTRSRKTEAVTTEKEYDVPVTKPPERSEKDIPLLVIETVGNKAVKQDVLAKDEQMRDFVKDSIRKQGMLKQELELNEKNEDAEQFENREKRNLTVNRNTGETVLHKASRMGYDETVYHCIQQGSDSNAKDNAGWTPLHEACSRGHSDVVRVLVKYNADINACSNDGIRPIHDAADNGNLDSLRLLMAYGADPFISTYSGRSVLDCAKRSDTKEYIQGCIGDLYLNDERNHIVAADYENRWSFRGSSSVLDKDLKYSGDVFDNVPKQQSNNSLEIEWSETPHLQTYSLPLIKEGIVVGRKNYVLLHDLQQTLNKPRQNVVKLLKRTKIREVSWTEFKNEVSSSYFIKLNEQTPVAEEGKVELVPLNWTVRSLLKIKCEHLAL
ncbi:protein piccolo-like isoform X2 [Dendronephthya gigantea]|nr:protein piccolo-like isoform X2 [Dendronephthya gigantea]